MRGCIGIAEVVREGFSEEGTSEMKREGLIGIWQVKAAGPAGLART